MRRIAVPSLALLLASAVTAQTVSLRDLSASFETLSQRVRPAVVQVFTSAYAPLSEEPEGGNASLLNRQRGTGSGVILSADGFVITNFHVVEGGRTVKVRLQGAAQRATSILAPAGATLPAKLIGVDRETDLALLKIEATGLPHLALSNSDHLRQGQIVLAFGNPLGLESSVSMGIVSSVARQLKPDDPVVYVQTDAPINPGNSGGPLVNDQGEVVGINTFILSQSGGSEGIGFAVPSNIVRNVFSQLQAQGHVRRGQIGIYAQNVNATMAAALGLPQTSGVIVSDVAPDGPAEAAGVKVGDIVVALNGRPIENSRQLHVRIYAQVLKEKLSLEVLRDGKKITLEVPVVERVDDPLRFLQMADPVKNVVPKLGILAIALDEKIASMIEGVRYDYGLLVAARSNDAAAAGLEAGDVIYSINRTPVVSLKSLQAELDRLKPGAPLVLQIQRGPRLMYLTIEPD